MSLCRKEFFLNLVSLTFFSALKYGVLNKIELGIFETQYIMKESDISGISKELIASNKLQEVFDLLINYAKEETDAAIFLNDIILLKSRFNKLKKKSLLGLISVAEESFEMNRVVYSLLDLVSQLSQKTQSSEVQENENIVKTGEGGSTINIRGDFRIEDEIAGADKKTVEKLIQGKSIIRILFISSNPLDTDFLRLDREMRDIENELVSSKYRDKFEFIKFSAVRIGDLQNALLKYSPNFVHFAGHGEAEGIVLLDNKTDESCIVKSEPLAYLFKLFSNDIACIFLNSCYSEIQAQSLKKFIPNIIGMKGTVPDETAIEFAKVFYKGIGAGREISFSFEFAKNSIDLNNIPGNDIPVML